MRGNGAAGRTLRRTVGAHPVVGPRNMVRHSARGTLPPRPQLPRERKVGPKELRERAFPRRRLLRRKDCRGASAAGAEAPGASPTALGDLVHCFVLGPRRLETVLRACESAGGYVGGCRRPSATPRPLPLAPHPAWLWRLGAGARVGNSPTCPQKKLLSVTPSALHLGHCIVAGLPHSSAVEQ